MQRTASTSKYGRVVDLSAQQVDPPEFDPAKHLVAYSNALKRRVVTKRDVKKVDAIVVHQTGIEFGVSSKQIKAAGGDPVKAKQQRALGVAAHMTVFNTGHAVVGNPLDWYVYHAGSLNKRSLGVEIEGLFPQQLGSKQLFKGDLEEAAREGLAWLVEKGRAMGMPLRYIYAHRQSSMTRDDDPGEEIFRKLVLAFAVPTLGLEIAPDFTSEGKKLPAAWTTPWVEPRHA